MFFEMHLFVWNQFLQTFLKLQIDNKMNSIYSIDSLNFLELIKSALYKVNFNCNWFQQQQK